MCGIYGSVGFSPNKARIEIVAHRGPDGQGWEEYSSPAGPVALGHRRLAIIDTSDAGRQPMTDASGRFHLVFNGEIYNYLELRRELAAKGEIFTTASDSEVLLRALMLFGVDVLPRLRGMFAFLLWDDATKRLLAARDRYGIKPLYVVSNRAGIAFGSEIKQLLDLPGAGRRMNLARVHDFLASGLTDHTSETLFQDVAQLRAGESMMIDTTRADYWQVEPRRWHAIPSTSTLQLDEATAAARFRELLLDSVRLHLRSDVPVGSCLSGGLDSSSIVCLMTRLLADEAGGGRVNTISACFAEKSVDERPFIDTVVAATGSVPHFVFPRAEDVFDRASDMTWHQDEPFGSTSIFAQWCVFEEARRAGVKVMLDGQGADEQLAGYHSAFPYYLAGLARRGRLATLARTLIERHAMHGAPISGQAKHLLIQLLPPRVTHVLRRGHTAVVDHDWLASDAFADFKHQPDALTTAGSHLGLPPVTDIASLCVTMVHASNLQMLLHWEDRNSMAHGIEARVPFLDPPLVDFCLALGNDHKIVGGDTKRVLRRAMAGILPQQVQERRDKLGFATPESVWFRGPLREPMRDAVDATLRHYPGLLDAVGTRKLTGDMLDGRRPVNFVLWRIANLAIWGQRMGATL